MSVSTTLILIDFELWTVRNALMVPLACILICIYVLTSQTSDGCIGRLDVVAQSYCDTVPNTGQGKVSFSPGPRKRPEAQIVFRPDLRTRGGGQSGLAPPAWPGSRLETTIGTEAGCMALADLSAYFDTEYLNTRSDNCDIPIACKHSSPHCYQHVKIGLPNRHAVVCRRTIEPDTETAFLSSNRSHYCCTRCNQERAMGGSRTVTGMSTS